MANLFSVKDKVVVITGGTGVLGKAIAAHLAEEGAKVILLGRKTGNDYYFVLYTSVSSYKQRTQLHR